MALAMTDSIETLPGVPDADDLPDTITTPPEALAPLPGVTLDDLLGGLRALSRAMDGAMETMPRHVEALGEALQRRLLATLATIPPEGALALQHLCDALEAIQKMGLSGSPYSATVAARSPSGFPVAVTIQRTEGATFLAALTGLESWLIENKYTPQP